MSGEMLDGHDRRGVLAGRACWADEPTTALDVTEEEVMAILDDLRRESGLGMLFITDDLDLAAAISTYGRDVRGAVRGSPHLRRAARVPLHPYTAALAAARPDHQRSTRLALFRGSRCPRSRHRRAAAFAPAMSTPGPSARRHVRLAELDGGLSCAPRRELRAELLLDIHA